MLFLDPNNQSLSGYICSILSKLEIRCANMTHMMLSWALWHLRLWISRNIGKKHACNSRSTRGTHSWSNCHAFSYQDLISFHYHGKRLKLERKQNSNMFQNPKLRKKKQMYTTEMESHRDIRIYDRSTELAKVWRFMGSRKGWKILTRLQIKLEKYTQK
jgi:hypothetical protein